MITPDAERDSFSIESALAAMAEQAEMNASYFDESAGGGGRARTAAEMAEEEARAAEDRRRVQDAEEAEEEARCRHEEEAMGLQAMAAQEEALEKQTSSGGEGGQTVLPLALKAIRGSSEDGAALTWLLIQPE
jgi:hypothetical protein